jgi:hypothetical protein
VEADARREGSGVITPIERRIRIASILVIAGLLVEAVSFFWRSPLSFFLFLFGACGLAAAGIVFFLISLITVGGTSSEPPKKSS